MEYNYAFGRIKDGKFEYAPRELTKEGGFKILTNSKAEYALFGYLPVVREQGEGEAEEHGGVITVFEKEEGGEDISGDEFLTMFKEALEV